MSTDQNEQDDDRKSWFVRQRIKFIEFRLFWEGELTSEEIKDFFKVSIGTARSDTKDYLKKYPENVTYDRSKKRYKKRKNFTPAVYIPSIESYLSQIKEDESDKPDRDVFIKSIPDFAILPNLSIKTDPQKLLSILEAIRGKEAVEIIYQSESRPNPLKRWITPHAIGSDGLAWHIRGFCHEHSEFRNFLLDRMISTERRSSHEISAGLDYEWNNFTDFEIGVNPSLQESERQAVEQDFNLKGRTKVISIRHALKYYLFKRYGLGDEGNSDEQKIVLINKDAVNEKDKAIKLMANGAKFPTFNRPS